MRICSILLALILFVGCTSREKLGRSVNDVWVVGDVMTDHADDLDPNTLRDMGSFLKAFADEWAAQHDVVLKKEFSDGR